MVAKLFFVAGVLGVGGYVYKTSASYDPAVVPMPRAAVEKTLAEAVTTLPRKDGDGSIRIWSIGETAKGVGLRMQYSADAPVLRCDAAISEVAPDKTRVVPDCGGDATTSAIQRTTQALQVPMFEEHIQSTLAHRAFNRASVDAKEGAAAMANLGAMQREALKTASEMQRMQASVDRQMPNH